MSKNNEYSKTAIYLLVLAIQLFGAIFFVWQQLPSFRQVLLNPGEPLPYDICSDCFTICVFVRNASLVLVPFATCSNSFSKFERYPESCVFVSRPPQLHFRKCI